MKRKEFTDEEILIVANETYDKLGHMPTIREWDKLGLKPAAITIHKRFGGWEKFWHKLGVHRQLSKEEIIEKLQAEFSDEPVSGRKWDRRGFTPCSETIIRRFGSFLSIVREAGLEWGDRKRYSDNEMIYIMRSVFQKYGQLGMNEWEQYELHPVASLYHRRFGSWNNAVRKAGYIPFKSGHSNPSNAIDRPILDSEIDCPVGGEKISRKNSFNHVRTHAKREGWDIRAINAALDKISVSNK